jgi:glycosyltransferase involved in cell wall biosynthesis
LERIAAFACHRIVTVSEYHRRWALDLGIANPQKVVAIPNGITPDRVQVDLGREAIRQELGISMETRMVLSTGRLAHQKGLEYLLEAALLVKREIDVPFKLVLAGAGPLYPFLEKLIHDRSLGREVALLGFRADIGDLLAASDIVVLPSLHEGLSIALLEAMAAGKPIVATTIGSNLEVTNQGQAALLVPARNSEALANAITRFIRNPSVRLLKSTKARELFGAHYTEERMIESYKTLYLSLLVTRPAMSSADYPYGVKGNEQPHVSCM